MTTSELLFGTTINTTSTTELAAAVGVSPRTINYWKRDPGKIPLSKFKLIVRARRLSPDDIAKAVKEVK